MEIQFYTVSGYRLGDPEEQEEEIIVAVWDGDLPEFIDDSIMFQVNSLSEIEEAIETGEPLVDDFIVLAYEEYQIV